MLYILLNIFRILTNLFETLIPFFRKRSVIAMATLSATNVAVQQMLWWWATSGSGRIFRHLWPMNDPLWTLSECFQPSLTISELYQPYASFAIICQPQITIVNSHNHSPHVCKSPATLHDIFRPFPTLLSLKFRWSSYSDILPVSSQLSRQLLARLCSL